MSTVEFIGDNVICYQSVAPLHIREYYNYCVTLLLKKLSELKGPINVIFGRIPHTFNNTNPTIKIDIQCEHTVVKDGGRGVNEIVLGNTLTENGECYLVRVSDFNYFNNLDVVIEYSIPNITHIRNSGHFNDYTSKLTYISSLIYDVEFISTNRKNTITLFTNNVSDRRNLFTNNVLKNSVSCTNVDGCYGGTELREQYDKTKILVNVHQTDHHHTFEELRVLPALSRGVIVISEDVPLKEEIPYGEYIIWSSYDNLLTTIKDVQDNYDIYHKRVFNNNLKNLLLKMRDINNDNLNILKKYE